MCVVSMVMDHYEDKFRKRINDLTYQPITITTPGQESPITDEEIREFRNLLERARKYDEENNQPDCELQDKKDLILKLAEELGVKIDFL